MAISAPRLNPLQTDEAVIAIDSEEKTTTDAIFSDEWNQAQGRKTDSATALGDHQQSFC